MSFQYLAWAQSIKTGSHATKAVLMALCSVVNDDGFGWPSQKRIASDTELGVRTVRRCMDWLETNGYMTRERRYREDGYRSSDLISLHKEPLNQEKSLAATVAPNILAATVSNLSGHCVLSEPVIEPVNINNSSVREKKLKTSFPQNFTLDQKTMSGVIGLGFSQDEILDQIERMRDWAKNADGAKGRKADWQAFARNWFKKQSDLKFNARSKSTPSSKSRFTVAAIELRQRLGLGEDHESARYDLSAGP